MIPINAVLLIVDVQQAFLDPSWGSRNNPDAEANIARLISAWRRDGRPIRHVHHASRSPDGLFQRGAPGHEPKPEAMPAPGEPVHVKEVNSSFIGTTLEADLRAAGVDTLVIVGLLTNHCVSTTARMAGNLGFETYVVEDATATFDRIGLDGKTRLATDVHAAALSDLSGEFATITHTDELLQKLDTPQRAAYNGFGGLTGGGRLSIDLSHNDAIVPPVRWTPRAGLRSDRGSRDTIFRQ